MQPGFPIEEQPIKPTPAVIIKPPVLFRKPTPKATPAAKPATPVAKPSGPMVRPPVPAVKAPLPVIKLPAPPAQANAPVPISTSATTQVSASMVTSSPAVNQERWDEDSFHGLWDTVEDKGLDFQLESGLSSSTIPVSSPSGLPQFSKSSVVQQTVDYGHGHGRGQG